jgi:protein-serine/threonine kinase
MPVVDSNSRTAATDDDGADHIGFETPRSGIATPQPDLQDKRLPGIMSYFGQVRQDSPSSEICSPAAREFGTVASPAEEAPELPQPASATAALQSSKTDTSPPPSSHPANPGDPSGAAAQHHNFPQPLPTPPISLPSSSGDATAEDGGRSRGDVAAAVPNVSDSSPGATEKTAASQPANGRTADVPSGTLASDGRDFRLHDSLNAHSGSQPQSPSKPIPTPPEHNPTQASSSRWFTLDGLKELTLGVFLKSGPPTPTRALSAAHPSRSEGVETPSRLSHDGGDTSGTQTPRRTAAGQPPTAKGKLTIKITEARGLRKCRDPYVVAVFQRSELISGGPHPAEEEESLSVPPSGLGGIPIQRQGSDSGRTPMAIPMRSRQSSNTSISDYNTFRNRAARGSFTKPKWDAEAVLYVPQSQCPSFI